MSAIYAMAVFLDARSKLFKAHSGGGGLHSGPALHLPGLLLCPPNPPRPLRAEKPADSLIPFFEEEWNTGSHAGRQARALLALTALGGT